MFDPISDFWDPLHTLIVPICMQRRVASEPVHQSYNNLINPSICRQLIRLISTCHGGRTDLVVRASDSGSGDPGSILDRVGVLFP